MNLNFVCTCGHRFPSDLNRWGEFNAQTGEVWWETCPECDTRWEVDARIKDVTHPNSPPFDK